MSLKGLFFFSFTFWYFIVNINKCNWFLYVNIVPCYNVSVEKSADSIMGVPLYITHFLLLLWKLSIFNFCHVNYNMSWYRSVCVHPVWDLLSFCSWISVSFFRFGNSSAIISLNTFLIHFFPSSPNRLSIMHRLAHFILSHKSFILLSFFF